MPLVRSVQPRPVHLGGRKFAHGGKGAMLTDQELKVLHDLKDGGVAVGALAFSSGVLEVVDDAGKVVPYPAPAAPQTVSRTSSGTLSPPPYDAKPKP